MSSRQRIWLMMAPFLDQYPQLLFPMVGLSGFRFMWNSRRNRESPFLELCPLILVFRFSKTQHFFLKQLRTAVWRIFGATKCHEKPKQDFIFQFRCLDVLLMISILHVLMRLTLRLLPHSDKGCCLHGSLLIRVSDRHNSLISWFPELSSLQ